MTNYYFLFTYVKTKTCLYLADSLVIASLEMTAVTFGCHLNVSTLFPYSLLPVFLCHERSA